MALGNRAIDYAGHAPSPDAIATAEEALAGPGDGVLELPHQSANPVHSLQQTLTSRIALDGGAMPPRQAPGAAADLAGRLDMAVAALSRVSGPVLLVAAVAAIVALII